MSEPMGYRITACGFSIPGDRSRNEDAFLILDEGHEVVRRRGEGCLFAVADGLGGHGGGAVASRMALDTLVEFFDTVAARACGDHLGRLERLFHVAGERILQRGRAEPALAGMGTTLTAVHVAGDVLSFLHAGDSRLMRVRGRGGGGGVERLTEEENVARRLVREGALAEGEYAGSPLRASLLNYLGKPGARPRIGAVLLCPGDRLLLATDGVTAVVEDGEIPDLVTEPRDATEACRALRLRVEAANPGDNATAVAILIEGIEDADA